MNPERMILKPGDSHPLYPHWKVEQVFHSPDHMSLTKFQWVRRDGVRGTLMGWIGLFSDRVPTYYSDGRSNIGADFDLKCADKNIPLGSDDTTLTTLRWYSWSWADKVPPPDGSEPMVFDEVSTSTQEET